MGPGSLSKGSVSSSCDGTGGKRQVFFFLANITRL